MTTLRSASFFLVSSGVLLLAIGSIGFLGYVGPTVNQSIFGLSWFFTPLENWAHIVVGLLLFSASFVVRDDIRQRQIAIGLGYLAGLVAVASFFLPTIDTFPPGNLGVAGNLENPPDTILYLVVAVWAFWSTSIASRLNNS